MDRISAISTSNHERSSGSCLVTGGSGFIGTHLIRELVASPDVAKVIVLDIVPPKFAHPKLVFLEHDLRASELPRLPELAACDTCYHLAALCKEPGHEWEDYFRTNYMGTVNLLRLLDEYGIDNLIFTSTIMVFKAGETKQHEDSLVAPDTAYGMSKALAEVLVDGWRQGDERRRLRVVRPGVVFGENDTGNFTRLINAIRRRRFAYIGRKDTIKGCIYVKDVVDYLRLVTIDTGVRTTYNLVYPSPYTIGDICAAIRDVFGGQRVIPTVPFRVAWGAAWICHVSSALGLNTGIHPRRIEKLYNSTDASADCLKEIGFSPRYSLHDALTDWRPTFKG